MISPFSVDLPPGSIVVVGPKGRLAISVTDAGRVSFHAVNCDFIGPSNASAAHRAIVSERWETRDENGRYVDDVDLIAMNDLPKWFSELASKPPQKDKAWWNFWKRGKRP